MRILRFLTSYIKWAFFGFKYRTQAQIDKLYSVCSGCDKFEEYAPACKFGECKVCGCNINKERKTLNKLAWVSTRCPLKKW